MGTEPSRRIVVLLEIGAVGYSVGAVAWSLFWLAIARNYVGVWWGYWFYVGFFVVALSLIMVGLGVLPWASFSAVGQLWSLGLSI